MEDLDKKYSEIVGNVDYIEDILEGKAAGWFYKVNAFIELSKKDINQAFFKKRWRFSSILFYNEKIDEKVLEKYLIDDHKDSGEQVKLIEDGDGKNFVNKDILREIPVSELFKHEIFIWEYTCTNGKQEAYIYSANPKHTKTSRRLKGEVEVKANGRINLHLILSFLDRYLTLPYGNKWKPEDVHLHVVPQIQLYELIAKFYSPEKRRSWIWPSANKVQEKTMFLIDLFNKIKSLVGMESAS